jgi:micrococcal nuclease
MVPTLAGRLTRAAALALVMGCPGYGASPAVGAAKSSAAGRRVPRGEKARVVYVNDGDTITVRLQNGAGEEKERVRLIGLDVPETDDLRPEYKQLALAGRAFATEALKGRVVTLERDPLTENRDAFGRLLRYVVTTDGTNFNEEMIRRGYGRVYRRFKFSLKDRFSATEEAPRAAKKGYWLLPPGPSRIEKRRSAS